ncbi:MAG: tetratricopeptide repeat protein [Desulfobacterales bacterium]
MARKSVSRSRKRDLTDPDEFISFWTKLFDFVTAHKVPVSCALGAFLILLIIGAATLYFLRQSENKAFSLLQDGIAKYQTILKTEGPDKAYKGAEKDFQQIIKNYPQRQGGILARLYYADMCYAAKDYDKAITLYNPLLTELNEEPFLKNLVLNGLGYCYEAKKDYKRASGYFEMVATAQGYPMKDEALFNLGEMYAAIGNKEKSINAFKKILSDYPESIYTEIVKEKVSENS